MTDNGAGVELAMSPEPNVSGNPCTGRDHAPNPDVDPRTDGGVGVNEGRRLHSPLGACFNRRSVQVLVFECDRQVGTARCVLEGGK